MSFKKSCKTLEIVGLTSDGIEEDIDHFLEHGYVVIKGAFSPEQSREWTKDVWVRLGMDPNDKRTWTKEKVNMPWHSRRPVEEFAPKVEYSKI